MQNRIIQILLILSFISCGKNEQNDFSEKLRKALGVQPLNSSNSSPKGKLVTPSSDDLLSQKNSIKACPEDSNLQGKAFPSGKQQWCSYKDKKNIDVRHGEYRIWHNNGKVKIQCFYIDGEIDGQYREWYENGVIKESSTYRGGNRVGKTTIYSKEAKIIEEITYQEDYKQGLYVKYSNFSKPIMKGSFNKDQRHGIWELYDQHGKLKEKLEFQNDIKHGKSEKYNPNGGLLSTGFYDKGIEVGHWSYYDKSGKKTSEGNLINGKRHGKWVEYGNDGLMHRIHYYENGRRTDSIKIHTNQDQTKGFGSRDILGAEPPIRRNSTKNQNNSNNYRNEKPTPLKKDEGWSPL